MTGLRKLLVRAIAILFGLALAILFAEVALRLLSWPGPPLRSGRLETQHRSPPSRPDFRDRPNPLASEKADGVYRIVVVGDSFTWGAGVLSQDAYPDVLAEELERRARRSGAGDEGEAADTGAASDDEDPDAETVLGARNTTQAGVPAGAVVEVVNFSRPGWNTVQEHGALQRTIDRLSPDLLVLGYCLNDAEPHRRRELVRLRRGLYPREPETAVERFLHARSALFRLAFRRADNVRMRRATAAYYHRFYVDGQPTWVEAQRALTDMRALAASRAIPFVVVVFPIFDSQLDHRYRYHALHETMRVTGAELEIDVVDLLPRYAGIDARRLALDPFLDAHPSELGHRIAAIAILEELEARGHLPGGPGDRAEASSAPTPEGPESK